MYGDRNAALANDLTKLFEKVQRGPLSTLLDSVKGKTLKGEYIVVIAGVERAERKRRKYGESENDADDNSDEQDEPDEAEESGEQDDD